MSVVRLAVNSSDSVRDNLGRLIPLESLIRALVDWFVAGKSWPVNMRHEVHGKDSGQGLQSFLS
jgi:hypothetical protein